MHIQLVAKFPPQLAALVRLEVVASPSTNSPFWLYSFLTVPSAEPPLAHTPPPECGTHSGCILKQMMGANSCLIASHIQQLVRHAHLLLAVFSIWDKTLSEHFLQRTGKQLRCITFTSTSARQHSLHDTLKCFFFLLTRERRGKVFTTKVCVYYRT